jgi:FkbM family methyltransferase
MTLFRKLKTLSTIIEKCSNWPEIILMKLGLSSRPVMAARLRNGLVIEVDRNLAGIWGEVFEPAVADVYGVGASDADLFIDVGTNVGSFSSLAGYTHPAARIYAFEPEASVAAQAEHNFKRNNVTNVTLTRAPVTGDGRQVQFSRHSNRGASNIYEASEAEPETMASVTLDCVDFAGAKSLFVKLDCEGAEGEIIAWIVAHRARLPSSVKISCEYHPWCPIPREESMRRLEEAGFQVRNAALFGAKYLFADSKMEADPQCPEVLSSPTTPAASKHNTSPC